MLKVIKPGFFSTIQDRGRQGYQQFGVIVSGAMDSIAYRLGNALLQQQNAAALEMTCVGGTFLFTQPTTIVLTGGHMQATIHGKAIPMYQSILIQAGDILCCGAILQGTRSYLCIRGGFTVPVVMNSRSTYLRAGIGGFEGRALQVGDCIPYIKTPPIKQPLHLLPHTFYKDGPIRIVHGTEWDRIGHAMQTAFSTNRFTISLASDRMGYRLLPQQPIHVTEPFSLLSEAVTFGTIQLPPNGEPILLMADHQTTGGYPKIAQVIYADLHRLAQLAPMQTCQFKLISLAHAEQLDEQLERKLRLLEQLLIY